MGATRHIGEVINVSLKISIHAPVKGATWGEVGINIIKDFNPRSGEGSDFDSVSHRRV